MTLQRRQVLAAVLATSLLLLMLLLASLDGVQEPGPDSRIVLREVLMYEPPTPPPPPQSQERASGNRGQPLTLVSRESEVTLAAMDLDVTLPGGKLGIAGLGPGSVDEGLGQDWGTVNLSDLDGFPTVVSAPLLAYPEELAAQNVHEFQVKFHILIDEEGNTYPVSIVENPYPPWNRLLLEYAARVRFTPPRRIGIAVKTEYLWPVRFSNVDE